MNRGINSQISRTLSLLTLITGAFAVRADDVSIPSSTPTTNESTNVVGTGSTAVGAGSTMVGAGESTNSISTPSSTPTTNESTNVVGTGSTTVGAGSTNFISTPPPTLSYQPFSLAAEAGTTGFGGTAGWRFADHFGVVGGMDYFSFSLNRTISSIPYSAHLRLMSERAGLNWYPWTDHSFYLSLGAYFNQNRLSGSAVSDGTLTVNGTPVPAGDSVNLTYKQQPVDPYVSIGGNLYFDKAKHFSLGTELGAFYLGNPKVSVGTTPSGAVPQSDLNAYQQQAEHDLKKLPVWPVLKVSICYSF
jgi:hypothetical protein